MANEVINFETTTDPVQAKVALNAAFDGTTQTGLKAESANSAANVTTNINGMAISSIFESDKKTVKKATSADHATLADAAKGDTRFQLSGCIGGGFKAGGTVNSWEFPAYTQTNLVTYRRKIPAGKKLKLYRVGYHFYDDIRLIIFVYSARNGYEWTTISDDGEDVLDGLVLHDNTTSSDELKMIYINILNEEDSEATVTAGNTWWLDLAIEDT